MKGFDVKRGWCAEVCSCYKLLANIEEIYKYGQDMVVVVSVDAFKNTFIIWFFSPIFFLLYYCYIV